MSQLRRHSALEVCLNTASGFALAYLTNLVLYWWLAIPVNSKQNLLIVSVFTIVSLVRSYFWRRLFNWLQWRME